MRIVDLSIPIDDRAPEAHPFWIERLGHKKGVEHLNWVMMKKSLRGKLAFLLGRRLIKPEALPDGEFLSLETVHAPVHTGTHLDFTFHYGTASEGKPSRYSDEIPLEWCFSEGVVLDFTGKEPGGVIAREDVLAALEKAGCRLKPGVIVLLRTGADKYFGSSEYLHHYPGVGPQAIEFLLEQGVKIIGIDTLGFDRPYKYMMADFIRTGDAGVLWPAHFYGRKKEYAHIERLANLDKLPACGFKVACFPVKIRNTGAAWARVVAILED